MIRACTPFCSDYSLLTRLLASRSERCSHSRTFIVLSSGQMPNVYKCILYTFTVVFLTFCSYFWHSTSGPHLPTSREAGRLRHFCESFPLSILQILNPSISSIYLLDLYCLATSSWDSPRARTSIERTCSGHAMQQPQGHTRLWTLGMVLFCFLDPVISQADLLDRL